MPNSVLIVEDEENLLAAVKYALERDGYEVFTATDGATGLDLGRQPIFDLIILDVMLPELDGLELCRILRQDSDVPILMLTAKVEEIDRVIGLEIGADDYMTKPFSMRELLARVRAMLRRARMGREANLAPRVLTSNTLMLEIDRHSVTLNDKQVDMRPKEFALLTLLMENPGKALTRDQILDSIWGKNYVGDHRTVDVHIRWLRQKIETYPHRPKRIITVRGIGYRFED
ncbi:MAG: response regulator transcription factor [SAR202 cluster bacterium]|nr:response regulator transcription factor [SAR202 cluster bacterium]